MNVSPEEELLSSYDVQISYYTDFIKVHVGWEFAGIYADEGLTGTLKEGRSSFSRMIDDAVKEKKIDLILTKSISRLARNTVDSLSIIRKLKDHGVELRSTSRRRPCTPLTARVKCFLPS